MDSHYGLQRVLLEPLGKSERYHPGGGIVLTFVLEYPTGALKPHLGYSLFLSAQASPRKICMFYQGVASTHLQGVLVLNSCKKLEQVCFWPFKFYQYHFVDYTLKKAIYKTQNNWYNYF